MDADALDDSPLISALLVFVQIAAMPSVEYILAGSKEMRHVVDFTVRTLATRVEFDRMVRDAMSSCPPLEMRRHADIDKRPRRTGVDTVIICRLRPIGGLHEVRVQPIHAATVTQRSVADALEVG